jgi:reversibly glycosylated polypeptide / UDP-arabinopyranose mutase
MTMKTFIVVPTIRENSINEFLLKWNLIDDENTRFVIVEDNPTKTFKVIEEDVIHVSWEEIDRELGDKAWIIPRRTDCVRSFGFYLAWKMGADCVISLDDDCLPVYSEHDLTVIDSVKRFLCSHQSKLNNETYTMAWEPTTSGVMMRGMPYLNQSRRYETIISHGLWHGIEDYDAITQLYLNRPVKDQTLLVNKMIPKGYYYQLCGMNVSFKREALPMMYFLLMGKDYPFDRWGDIWCGIFSKKIADHLNYGVKSGEPYINHSRASNVWANLRKEASGYEVNETLWKRVDEVVLTNTTVKDCYRELAEKLDMRGEYWDTLKRAMIEWTELFE